MADFSNVQERLQWARQRRKELEFSIIRYKKQYPILFSPHIADDRLSWEMRVKIKKAPPMVKWGFWHADIVHILRSILDNAVWEIAHSEGVPTRPIVLEYPIAYTADKWPSKASVISDLPSEYQGFIAQSQPFARDPNDLIGSTLKFVHMWDIQNKHHAPVVAGLWNEQEFMNTNEIVYRVQPGPNETKSLTITPFQFVDGFTVLREVVPKPIEMLKNGNFRMETRLVIADECGAQYPLLGSLDHLISGCELIIEELRSISSTDSSPPDDSQPRHPAVPSVR